MARRVAEMAELEDGEERPPTVGDPSVYTAILMDEYYGPDPPPVEEDGAAGTADYDPPPSLFLSSTNVYRAFPATGPTGPDAHKTVKSALRTAEWGTPGGWREVARCGDEARHGAVRRGQGGPLRALPRVPAIVFA